MKQPILVNEEDLINFLSGTSIPPFVADVPEGELEEFTEALNELAEFLGLTQRITDAYNQRVQKNGIPMDMRNTEEYKQMLRDWGLGELIGEPASSPLQSEMYFESPLPGFARKAYDGILEPMVVLQTRNGECVGNAIVTEVRYDTNNGDILVTVCTDACNMVVYCLEEIEERFHKPKWVAKGFINESVRQRVMKYYGRD